jgi:phosphohistidine phosphatase
MIWLLRHGDAQDGSPDSERPLTDKGRRQSRSAGAALAALGVEIDACLTSPKVRALDTARITCEQLDGPEPQEEPRLAGGEFDPEELAAGLGDNVLLVGHEPDFSDAIRSLTSARVDLKKGGVAAIDGGTLILLLRPRELKRMAAG